MEWTRKELKEKAKFSVKAFYWKSVLAAFVLALVSGDFGSGSGRGDNGETTEITGNGLVDSIGGRYAGILAFVVGLTAVVILAVVVASLALSIFVFNPLQVGCKKYFLDASDGNADLHDMGYSFQNNYMNIVVVTFLQNLFIFLWSLLLIIPGIVKAYQYRMIPYLLAEDPNLSFSDAKRLSTEMMDGEKWDAFVLDLSFILWLLLSACTFNLVGVFWVNPYIAYTDAELYKVLRVKVPGPYYIGNGPVYENSQM